MEQLNTAVTAALTEMTASGTIEKLITERVEKTVETAISDALRSYSDFGKQVDAAVKKSLAINTDELDIPQYNQFILSVLQTKIDEQLNIVGKEKIERDMEELLSGAAPKEVKLSKLIEDFKEFVRKDNADEYDENITVYIRISKGLCSGYTHIYLDPDSGKDRWACRYQLDVNPEGKVYGMQLDGKDVKNTLFLGTLRGFNKAIFHIYAAGSKVIIDPDAVDEWQPEYDDY
jgi:hypothetical protein